MLQPPEVAEHLDVWQIAGLRDAEYVQVISTSVLSALTGNSTIIVHPRTSFLNRFSYENHLSVVRMHEQIASGKLVMIASNSPDAAGKIYGKTQPDKNHDSLSECRVGVVNKNRPGEFHINVVFDKNYNIYPNQK